MAGMCRDMCRDMCLDMCLDTQVCLCTTRRRGGGTCSSAGAVRAVAAGVGLGRAGSCREPAASCPRPEVQKTAELAGETKAATMFFKSWPRAQKQTNNKQQTTNTQQHNNDDNNKKKKKKKTWPWARMQGWPILKSTDH